MSNSLSNNSLLQNIGTIERFVEPCILLLLSKNKAHGYGLLDELKKHCGEKVDIGNLYRTLRKMEKYEWVTSSWDTSEPGPSRRVYHITPQGKDCLKNAAISLVQTDSLIHQFLDVYQKDFITI